MLDNKYNRRYYEYNEIRKQSTTTKKEEKKMTTLKVNFANGDSFCTSINLNEEEATKYYLGRFFNLGVEDDNMQRCTSVEIL